MSRDLGFSNSIYSQWNTRKTKPSNKTVAKIANYFGVSVQELLGTEKAPTQESERKRNLRSVARLESSDITPELDANIADYIDYLLSKRENGE